MGSNSKMINWGLKEKLLSIVLAGVFTVCGMSYFSYTKIQGLENHTDDMGHEKLPMSEAIGEIKAASQAISHYMWLSLAFENMPQNRTKTLAKVNESINVALTNIEKASKIDINSETNSKIKDLASALSKLKEELPKAMAFLDANTLEKDKLAKDFLLQSMPQYTGRVTDLLNEISVLTQKEIEKEVIAADDIATTTVSRLIYFSILSGLALLFMGGWFTFHITRQMFLITEEVATASTQVSSASEQLSRTSEALSSASQEQASSIEETSASLTEIMGMVESNVKTAEGSNGVATEVHRLSEETRQFMESLAEAMRAILESNGRIEKLVKVIEEIGEKTEVIDDIVFKTQLLSFNASVEAERAGEHGRGFAVVAQEVGNLAQMSGKAATEIAGIVKISIKEAVSVAQENKVKVEKGGDLAFETKNRMVDVLKKITEILDGTNRIVIASKEQSEGINQITQSVEVLNKATQETASTAEESSSASQQLSAQSSTLMNLVSEMRKIITGIAHHDKEQANTKSSGKTGRRGVANIIAFPKKKNTSSPYKSGLARNNGRSGVKNMATDAINEVPSHTDEAWEKI